MIQTSNIDRKMRNLHLTMQTSMKTLDIALHLLLSTKGLIDYFAEALKRCCERSCTTSILEGHMVFNMRHGKQINKSTLHVMVVKSTFKHLLIVDTKLGKFSANSNFGKSTDSRNLSIA